jgi:hypothetical protein
MTPRFVTQQCVMPLRAFGILSERMKSFCSEHVFQAASTAIVFEAYFDPELQVVQDRAVEIDHREVLEYTDDGKVIRRVCRVTPRRQLPALLKPFSSGSLYYIETVTWNREDDRLSVEMRPSILKGRAIISGTYSLERIAPNAIRRRYAGEVSVDIALLAARIERHIAEELERSIPLAAACTQDWISRNQPTA